MKLARCTLALVLLAACGDDAATDSTTTLATTTTTTAATTTTIAADTTTLATTTTVPPVTTTTLGTGPLSDSFDGPTTATPYFGEEVMSFDTSVAGEVTITATSHDPTGPGTRLVATYPHLFRDGTMRMVFSGAADGTIYFFFLRSAVDFSVYTEVAVWPSFEGQPDSVYVTVRPANTTEFLSVPPGTYDPVGFNTLRVDVFDGTIDVFLNGVNLGQMIDPVGATEGVFGFGIVAFASGATMTVDEFVATSEVS